MDNILYFRKKATEAGLTVIGDNSPIVPLIVGSEALGRVSSSLLPKHNVMANLTEFPGVPINGARYRLQLMTDHTFEDCDKAIAGIKASIEEAKLLLEDEAYLKSLDGIPA